MIFLITIVAIAILVAIVQRPPSISISKLYRTEKERQISLPEIYKTFYSDNYHYRHPNLVGSTLFNDEPLLYEHANELLAENESEPLDNDDFVFLMHQGYFFYFFKADGNPDPIVYSYTEGKLKKEDNGPFSKFIKEYFWR